MSFVPYVENLSFFGQWARLIEGCRNHLRQLGLKLDEGVYQQQNLEQFFAKQVPVALHQEKEILRQPFVPPECQEHMFAGRVADDLDLEYTYIHFIRLVAIALSEPFKAAVLDALAEVLLDGRVCVCASVCACVCV